MLGKNRRDLSRISPLCAVLNYNRVNFGVVRNFYVDYYAVKLLTSKELKFKKNTIYFTLDKDIFLLSAIEVIYSSELKNNSIINDDFLKEFAEEINGRIRSKKFGLSYGPLFLAPIEKYGKLFFEAVNSLRLRFSYLNYFLHGDERKRGGVLEKILELIG